MGRTNCSTSAGQSRRFAPTRGIGPLAPPTTLLLPTLSPFYPPSKLLVKKVKALEQALGETVDLEGFETDTSGSGAIKAPAAPAGQQQQVRPVVGSAACQLQTLRLLAGRLQQSSSNSADGVGSNG